MEILGILSSFMLAILVALVLLQLVWAYALQCLATKNEMSSLGETLAWLPILNLYPFIVCCGGSFPRFLIGAAVYVVGAIGLGLLKHAREIRFNERSPDGLAGLERGLAARSADERSCARLFPGAAQARLDALPDATVVIVDPPRRGLDTPLRNALAATPPRRLVYLACGVDSLIEDLKHLLAPGGLRLAGLEVFDFFPFTEHIETLAWLDANPGTFD